MKLKEVLDYTQKGLTVRVLDTNDNILDFYTYFDNYINKKEYLDYNVCNINTHYGVLEITITQYLV